MQKNLEYKAVNRLDLSDPKFKMLHKLNAFAFISIVITSAVGITVNYCLRMLGEPGGLYFIYVLCGVVNCLIYPYVHEFAHAFAVIICRGKIPTVKFGKLAAYCGSPDIIFNKSQYFFVVSFPFVFYCALFIPLCILIPAEFFPMVFMPLMYNVFCSVADAFMINKATKTPKGGIIVDCGTDVIIYAPCKDVAKK